MALRKIVTDDDRLLRKPSREVNEITERIRALVEDMWETMYDANGVGLAAPQVGVLRRVVVIDAPEYEDENEDAEDADSGAARDETPREASGDETIVVKYALINPEIVESSEEMISAKEGCLSVPGRVGVVARSTRVKARALDMDGNPIEIEAEGMLAKALQHEIDHLNGILYTDIAESVEEVKAE